MPKYNRAEGRVLGDAIQADTRSLAAFETDVFGFIARAFLVFLPTEPRVASATFWLLLQIATRIGFATAYPANRWLIERGIRHAM